MHGTERDKKSTKINSPAKIYFFKVNNGNNRKRCKICSKLKTETPERRLHFFQGTFFHILYHYYRNKTTHFPILLQLFH